MLPADVVDRLLPDTEPTERWEGANPPRDLPAGAEVTRFAPSPTGWLHIGGVYVATVAKELAERSGGSYFVRIEDTDQARVIEGDRKSAGREREGRVDLGGRRIIKKKKQTEENSVSQYTVEHK